MKNFLKILLLLCIGLLIFTTSVWSENTTENESGYIVKLKENTVFLASETDLTPVIPQEGIYKTDEKTAAELQADGRIEYMEPDHLVYLADDIPAPNDPFYPQQWNLPMIGFPLMWNSGLDAREVRIGIIDSGVSTVHEELMGRVVGGYNFIDNNEDYNDNQKHGSFIAGIIGAATNNDKGITGGSNSKLYALKVFDGDTTYVSTIVKAIDLAVNTYHCHIINLSFTTPDLSKTLEKSIQNAVKKGVFVIAAVGNEGNEQLNYPAAFDGVFGVGSIDKNKQHSYFSNKNQSVDVVVPGEGITSVYIPGNPENGYGTGSGTSYAAPHMTLIAAYLKSIDPTLTINELEQLIKNYAEDLGEPGYDPVFGWGLASLTAFYQTYGSLDIAATGSNEFETSFFNYTNQKIEAVHIWALYDSNTGLLLDTQTEDYSLPANDITTLRHTFTTLPDTSYEIKSIWINSFSALSPLSDVKIYTSKE